MTVIRWRSAVWALLLGMLLFGGAVWAADTEIADDGTVFRARLDDDRSALYLEVRRPGEAPEILTVPDTENSEAPTTPSLEVDANTAYLVWIARRSYHYALYVASWDQEAGWSDTLEISGDPFSTKRNAQIAVTRDTFRRRADSGEILEEHRTMLHLVWWDEGGEGARPLSLSLPIIEGELGSLDRPVNLHELAGESPGTDGVFAPSSLEVVPEVVATDHGVRFGFVTPDGSGYAIRDVRIPSKTLRAVGDEARAQIIVFGQKRPSASLADLAARARRATLETSVGLIAPDVARYVADQLDQAIRGMDPGTDLETIADEARAQIIIFGSRFSGGLRSLHQEARAQIIVFGSRTGSPDGRMVLDERRETYPLPRLPEGAVPILGTGRAVIVWEAGPNALAYIELGPESPAITHTIDLSDGLTREEALDSLVRRAGL